VRRPVEEPLAVPPQVPVAGPPAHRGRIERREQRGPRRGRGDRLEVIGEGHTRPLVEGHLRDRDRRERGARLRGRPAAPPPQVVEQRGPEAREPPAGELGARRPPGDALRPDPGGGRPAGPAAPPPTPPP